MRAQPPKLSKTRYLSGLQCHLKLWNDCFERQLADGVTLDECFERLEHDPWFQ